MDTKKAEEYIHYKILLKIINVTNIFLYIIRHIYVYELFIWSVVFSFPTFCSLNQYKIQRRFYFLNRTELTLTHYKAMNWCWI